MSAKQDIALAVIAIMLAVLCVGGVYLFINHWSEKYYPPKEKKKKRK